MTEITLYNQLKQVVGGIVKKLKLDHAVKKKTGRPLALSITDILTLGLFKQFGQIETKKKLYEILEPICSYKTLVVSLNRFAALAWTILLLLMKINRSIQDMIKHIDSTTIPVCLNKNAKYHKTMKEHANWGHSSFGSFYGVKLHIITDLLDRLLSMGFTSGNVDDREMVMPLSKDIFGFLIGDAGYISQKLIKEFYEKGKRILIVKPRKNMKKIASQLDTYLYNTRWQIEFNFRNLKMFYGLVTSLPRSAKGYFANYIYSILAYTLTQPQPDRSLSN